MAGKSREVGLAGAPYAAFLNETTPNQTGLAGGGFVNASPPALIATLSLTTGAATIAATATNAIASRASLTAGSATIVAGAAAAIVASLNATTTSATIASTATNLTFAIVVDPGNAATLVASGANAISANVNAITAPATLSATNVPITLNLTLSAAPAVLASSNLPIAATLAANTSAATLIASASVAINASLSLAADPAAVAAFARAAIALTLSRSADAASLAAGGVVAINASLASVTDAATIIATLSTNQVALGLRETVMRALFARMQTLPGMQSYSRRMTLPGMVPIGDQPALMQWEQPELSRNRSSQPDKRVWEAWIVIVFTNNDPTIPGATIINPIIDGIESLLAVDDWAHYNCSLNGLVHYARIEGTIIKETGDTDTNGLGGCIVPIKIMPP